jgi:hypothetical protein
MIRRILIGIVVLAILAIAAFLVLRNKVSSSPLLYGATPQEAIYTIENIPVFLHHGISEVPVAPNSATMITTRYFGNDATGDLNGDGTPDTAFILTQNPGGSGTFYYVAVALKEPEGYRGTNAVLLGDRIAPQTLSIEDGILTVNYADRKPEEPMAAKPSVGVTKHFVVRGGVLGETQ